MRPESRPRAWIGRFEHQQPAPHSLCGHPVAPVHLQVSITFDPFLYLPVPLPQKQKVLPVFYFAREPHSKPIKVRTWPVLPGYGLDPGLPPPRTLSSCHHSFW